MIISETTEQFLEISGTKKIHDKLSFSDFEQTNYKAGYLTDNVHSNLKFKKIPSSPSMGKLYVNSNEILPLESLTPTFNQVHNKSFESVKSTGKGKGKEQTKDIDTKQRQENVHVEENEKEKEKENKETQKKSKKR
ncbi:hypothetical protein M0813_18680 [Anaeramoeba flamelloides]|uniref:Uncharacterized protein n=1 Tax=Anaeramoeba flamelloides TaxID=1746091 RepID=A0ABQ8YRD7_9EUKA|nr:hypothetical protein M0813_18680 [Anaeramoeba flamelloides]